MARQIALTRGLFATVDDEDFEYLSQWKWCAARQGRKGCAHPKWRAVRGVCENGKSRLVLMHRVITGADAGEVVDHDDGDPLNNRRKNLIVCTQKQNCQNRNPLAGARHTEPRQTSSRQKGVTWNKRQRRWVVQINRRHVGVYTVEAEAIAAARAALGS